MMVLSNNSLTRFVNIFVKGLRFQKIQALKDPMNSAYLLKLETYPSGRIIIARDHKNPDLQLWLKNEGAPALPSWNNQSTPQAILFFRAHFLNLSIDSVERLSKDSCLVRFNENKSFELKILASSLEFKFFLPDKKPFISSVSIATLPSNADCSEDSLSPSNIAADKKKEKLLAKIKADIENAETFLLNFSEVLKKFQADPSLWDLREKWSSGDQKIFEELFKKKLLPAWGKAQRKAALEKSYVLLRRMDRKKINGEKRYQEILNQKSVLKAKGSDKKNINVGTTHSTDIPVRPNKRPGLWVCLKNKIWVRIGRSATENDELFRQAKDRDLWFHVRGSGGSHVWVGRGQKSFGAKDHAPQWLIESAAQLALLNSQLRESGQATVDYTERRYLKKIKGQDGALSIQRSETLFVRKDEAFEKEIFQH